MTTFRNPSGVPNQPGPGLSEHPFHIRGLDKIDVDLESGETHTFTTGVGLTTMSDDEKFGYYIEPNVSVAGGSFTWSRLGLTSLGGGQAQLVTKLVFGTNGKVTVNQNVSGSDTQPGPTSQHYGYEVIGHLVIITYSSFKSALSLSDDGQELDGAYEAYKHD